MYATLAKEFSDLSGSPSTNSDNEDPFVVTANLPKDLLSTKNLLPGDPSRSSSTNTFFAETVTDDFVSQPPTTHRSTIPTEVYTNTTTRASSSPREDLHPLPTEASSNKSIVTEEHREEDPPDLTWEQIRSDPCLVPMEIPDLWNSEETGSRRIVAGERLGDGANIAITTLSGESDNSPLLDHHKEEEKKTKYAVLSNVESDLMAGRPRKRRVKDLRHGIDLGSSNEEDSLASGRSSERRVPERDRDTRRPSNKNTFVREHETVIGEYIASEGQHYTTTTTTTDDIDRPEPLTSLTVSVRRNELTIAVNSDNRMVFEGHSTNEVFSEIFRKNSGLHLHVLDPSTSRATFNQTYQTSAFGAYLDLARDLDGISSGRVVVLASLHDGSLLLQHMRSVMSEVLGSSFVKQYLYGDSWVWVFVKEEEVVGREGRRGWGFEDDPVDLDGLWLDHTIVSKEVKSLLFAEGIGGSPSDTKQEANGQVEGRSPGDATEPNVQAVPVAKVLHRTTQSDGGRYRDFKGDVSDEQDLSRGQKIPSPWAGISSMSTRTLAESFIPNFAEFPHANPPLLVHVPIPPYLLRGNDGDDDDLPCPNWPRTPVFNLRRQFCRRHDGYGDLCSCQHTDTASRLLPQDESGDLPEQEEFRDHNPKSQFWHEDIPVLILAHNRPLYLYRLLRVLLGQPGLSRQLLRVFVDGADFETLRFLTLLDLDFLLHRRVSPQFICLHTEKNLDICPFLL
ncbi:uncharacterized protein LOC143024435 [Oratosquilla oratoria]|uniref:uncharacterized protein LOC143024435 n=1 Tax=Oratosquilla oratoria TaxID=337810 RepID=UPI003F76FA98